MGIITGVGPLGVGQQETASDGSTLALRDARRPGVLGEPADACEALAPVESSGSTPDSVQECLRALGLPRAPEAVSRRVATALGFLQAHMPRRASSHIDFLKAIDFSHDVRVARLGELRGDLVQYMGGTRPGNFFSLSGVPAQRLGIATGARSFRKFHVRDASQRALVARAAPVSDTWTWGRERNVYSPIKAPPWGRAGELVGGGGVQILIPDPVLDAVSFAD